MTTTATLGHLFDDQAANYAEFRPTYPAEVYDAVYALAGPLRTDRALDVATGTGQVAQYLAEKFAVVDATDSSAGQLREAIKHPKITYTQAPAEDMQCIPDSSIDLVTVAEALHWFDHQAFFREVRRVLKPDGALAVWGYAFGRLEPGSGLDVEPPATEVHALNTFFDAFHSGKEWLGPSWNPRRKLVDQHYVGLSPSGDDFSLVKDLPLGITMQRETSVDDLAGLILSWSAYTTFRKQHPDEEDPLVPFKATVARRLGITDNGKPCTVRMVWPMFGFVAKGPMPL